MKFKFNPIVKKYEGEEYKFIGGLAKVPGMWHKGPLARPYVISLKDFKELTGE